LFINAAAGKPGSCPGSGAWFGHAYSYFTVKFETSCDNVEAEILARGSMQNSWHDPHNGGTYSVLDNNGGTIELKRVTGNKQYTDKQTFAFQSDGDTCQAVACSESQGSSLVDYGTNFCDLYNLFCNSTDCNGGICCKPITANGDFMNYQITTGPTCNTGNSCPTNYESTCLKTSSMLEAPKISPSLERILNQKSQ